MRWLRRAGFGIAAEVGRVSVPEVRGLAPLLPCCRMSQSIDGFKESVCPSGDKAGPKQSAVRRITGAAGLRAVPNELSAKI